ncbi:hypothetical protein [Xenorhabdus griffiniae]|nr:hypothetical protein [Xenorhabdus griffiniae]MBD1227083.1 hypothetical protein [Xenorhabdus griffiniae]MBE8586742.1 hypothetical protein [Xenorhabdus griffiniae]WMV74119.1 hypothetical protein QL128_09080 [Xenorhabdus griffiniae]
MQSIIRTKGRVISQLISALAVFICWNVSAGKLDVSVGWEQRVFFEKGLSDKQERESHSFQVGGKYFTEWDDGKQHVVMDALYRKDSSSNNREPFEPRDLYWGYIHNSWELYAGFRKVFWGVTEFSHPVDIINQSDLVDDPFGNEKLGQPMINLTKVNDWGIFDLFLLTGFRERTFPGHKARLRAELDVDTRNTVYQYANKKSKLDFAVRSHHTFGNVDLGLSYFNGTERTPEFVLNNHHQLVPYYGQIQQIGLEYQWNINNLIVKWEGAYRQKDPHFSRSPKTSFLVYSGGLEYTHYGVLGSSANLTFFLEYMKDTRNKFSDTPFENDIFAGVQFSANDEQDSVLFLGVTQDMRYGSRAWIFNGSRRLGDNFKLSLNGAIFENLDSEELLYGFRNESYIGMKFIYFFGI